MYKDDDVLDVLNTNTQNNNYNSGSSSDDELKVLNENTQNLPTQPVRQTGNKYGIGLTDDENAAREAGNLDFDAGINHVDTSDLEILKRRERYNKPEDTSGDDTSTTVLDDVTYNADGTPNTTKSLATDLVQEEKSISTSELYRDTLGRTAYDDLKLACGLMKNESFTDFYNRTHYIPKGWEIEARMCMIEEKRMKLYSEYAAGNMSESDFLYQAYGKDLMKESGYDLESKLFWYNRIKNGDHTSPLDSDTFMTDLIDNSRKMFQDETWYREAHSKELSDTLAGLVTGNRLSNEKFYEIFKNQVDALKPYFDDDVNKIITYYKAGTLGSAFSPFIDIDSDGKFDYYYHTDGRLYAVKGSSGEGNSQCTIEYNDNGSVHSVQINDGFDGPVDSLLEGFRDFWVGILDIVQMVDSAIPVPFLSTTATVDLFRGQAFDFSNRKYFIDAHQEWEAFKKSTWLLGDEDYVVFDDIKSYNANDWANGICKGIGQVAGMVLLAVLTWGVSTAVSAAKEGVKAGTEVGKEIVVSATKESIKQMIAGGSKEIAKKVAEKLGEKATQKAIERGVQQAIQTLSKELAKSMGKEAFKATMATALKTALHETGTTAAKLALKNAGTYVASGITSALQAGTKARSGFVLTTKGAMGSVWGQSVQIAATSAIRDFVQVGTSLEARNPALQYLEAATNGEIKALSTEEIWGRAAAVAGFDFAITTLFRAQGDIGASTRWNALFKNHSDLTKNALDLLKNPNITQNVRNAALNMTNHMGVAMWVDNAFDILENITTAGAQAAFSNPYARNANQWWESFWQSAYNPQSLIMNAYVSMKNTISFGTSSNMVDSRKSTFIRSTQANAAKFTNMIPSYIRELEGMKMDSAEKDTKIAALNKLQQAIVAKSMESPTEDSGNKMSASAKSLNNVIEIAQILDQVFSGNDAVAVKAFGLTEAEAKEVKLAIDKLNSTKGEGEPEYGIASAVLFNTASKEYANDIRKVYVDLLNTTGEKAANTNKVWKTIADWTGKLPFTNYLRVKKAQSTFNTFIQNLATQQGIDIGTFAQREITDLLVSGRFKTMSYDESGTTRAVFEAAIASGLIKTYTLSDASAMDGMIFDLEEVKDTDGIVTGYNLNVLDSSRNKVTDTSKFADNPFFQLFLDYRNNRAAIDKLIRMGVIGSLSDPEDRDSLYNVIASGTPWFGFTIDDSRRNELLSSENEHLRTLVLALDTISDLFDPEVSGDDDGYAGINWSTPLLVRLNYSRKNSEGADTDSNLYIIPNLERSTYLDVVNRLQAAQSLVYEYYKIYSLSKNSYRTLAEDQELQEAVIKFAMLTDENLTMEKFDEVQRILSDKTLREKYLETHLLDVAKGILLNATMDKEETSDGYGRNQLIRLYRDGILNENILKNFAEVSEKTTKVGKIANEILGYTDLVNLSKEALRVLSTFETEGKITTTDFKLLEDYVSKMNEPQNKSLRQYLEKDNKLTPYIKQILDNPGGYLPFYKGLDGSGRRLSQGNYSAVLERKNLKDSVFEEFLNGALDSFANDYVEATNDYTRRVRSVLTNAFYGDSKAKSIFSGMTSDKLIDFLSDPVGTLSDLKPKQIKTLFDLNDDYAGPYSTDASSLIKYILDRASLLTEDNSIDTNKLFVTVFNMDSDSEFDEAGIKHEILYGDSDNANIFRKLIMISAGEPMESFTKRVIDDEGNSVEFVRIKDNQVIYGKTGEELGDLLFKNENVKLLFSESKKENIINLIKKDVLTYDEFISNNTTIAEAKNIVEVNLLELLPKNLQSAVSKMIESDALRANTGWKADARRAELESDIQNLFTGYGSNSMTEQYSAYRKFVLSKLLTNNFLLNFDISNKDSIHKFRMMMGALGYGTDVAKILSGADVINGVSVKDKPTHVLNAEVNANKVFDYLMNANPISFIHSKALQKDYVSVLRNLFSSNTYVTDDTTFTTIDDKGKPIRMFNVTLDGEVDDWGIGEVDGTTYLERAIKAALQGGQFSKVFSILNRTSAFTGNQSKLSADSYKAYIITKAVFDYLGTDTEYSYKIASIDTSKKMREKIDALYKTDHSLWRVEHVGNTTYFYKKKGASFDQMMAHFSKDGFNLLELIPLWNPNTSLKSVNTSESKNASYETLFTIISELGFEGLTTPEEFFNYAQETNTTPLKIMGFGSLEDGKLTNKSYDDFALSLNGKTLSEIESIIAANKDLVDNDYFANCLAFEFKKARASTNTLKTSLESSDVTKNLIYLCNSDILTQLGSLLNTDFKNIFVEGINDENVAALTRALNERLGTQAVTRFNTSSDYYSVDSGFDSIAKLTPTTKQTISEDTIRSLLTVLSYAEDNQIVSMSTDTGLAKRSPILNCFNFLEIGDEGKLTVSMEDYIKAPLDDRLTLIKELQLLVKSKNSMFEPDELTSLNNLIAELKAKNKLITDLSADRGLSEADSVLKTVLTVETTKENEPSFKVFDYFLSSGDEFNKHLAAQLVANRSFIKSISDKFISLSSADSMQFDDINKKLLSQFLIDGLNRTVVPTTDKVGSTLIYNMKNDEAIGDFFLSAYSWAQMIKDNLFMSEGSFVNKFKGMSEADVDRMLYDLSIRANLYSTGTIFAAEYGGALMLVYDEDTKSYSIEPIKTSVANPDDDIYHELLFGQNNLASLDSKDNKKVCYLFKLNQNSFIDNASGYKGNFSIFDLNDAEVRNSLIANAYFHARRNSDMFYINRSKMENYQDVFKKYYIDRYHLKSSELRQNYINKAKQYGLNDRVILTTLQTVQNLSSAQETSWSEQALNTVLSGIKKDIGKGNLQFIALKDALLYGINKDSLSDQTLINIRNYITVLDAKFSDDEVEILNRVTTNFFTDEDIFKTEFAKLSSAEQDSVIQKILFEDENINGISLMLLANYKKGKNVFDTYSELKSMYSESTDSKYFVEEVEELFNKIRAGFSSDEEFENALKNIDLKNMSYSDLDEDIFDGATRLGKDNAYLKSTIEAFNLIESSKSLRADSKELENKIIDVLYGGAYVSKSRKSYISSIKSVNHRNDIRNVFLNLLAINGVDAFDPELDSDALKTALQKSFNSISLAARDFTDNLRATNPYDDDIQSMSIADGIGAFLSADTDTIRRALKLDTETYKVFAKSDLLKFDEKGNKIFKAFLDNFDFRSAEIDSMKQRFTSTVMDPLRRYAESGNEEYLDLIDPNFFVSNVIRVSGYTTEGKELYNKRQAIINKYGRILEITSNTNKELHDYITDKFFKEELYQKVALWQMAHEHAEFKDDEDYGTVRVNSNLINKAFDTFYKDKDEFYTLMWRQPGQQTTVTHNMKVIVDDSVSGMAFSRRTARDFFNGDFDGDAYFFAKPDKASQFFGEKAFKVLNYGGSLFDSLFKDIDIPEASAKEYANTENLITEYFKQDAVANKLKNVLAGGMDYRNFNSELEDWLISKGIDSKRAADLVDSFGIKEFDTALADGKHRFRSNNYILAKLGTMYSEGDINAIDILDEGQQAFLRSAFLLSDEDATWLGQSSKGQKRHFKVNTKRLSKISDTLYETTLGMAKDSAAYLNKVLASLDSTGIDSIRNKLISYVESGVEQGFVSKKFAETLTNEIRSKASFDSDDLLILGQLLQESKLNSKQYSETMKSIISAPEMQEERTERNNRMLSLVKLMREVGGYDGIADVERRLTRNPYGPESLKIGSELVSMLMDKQLMQQDMFVSMNDATGASQLLRDFATKANVEVVSKNNLNIISHKGLTNIHKNIVGLSGKVCIAVDVSGEFTDSIGVYDRSQNKKANLNINSLKSYTLEELTDMQKSKLATYLTTLHGDVDPNDIQKIIKTSGFDIHGKQRIIAVVDRFGNQIPLSKLTADNIHSGMQIIFNRRGSIMDALDDNTIKVGAATTKNFKGTGFKSSVVFDDSQEDIPQFIVPEAIAGKNGAKFSHLTSFNNTGKTIKDSNGREYALCYLDNMELLNVLDLQDQSVDVRNMDAVSLLSGSQGIDATFNMGNLFITIDSEGNVIYDPSGYHTLMSTIGKYTKPVLQDVNGANLVRYNRIAILLNELKDSPDIAKIVNIVDDTIFTPKELMASLENCGDLGGYFGERIENYLWNKIVAKGLQGRFFDKLHSKKNPFIRMFFSTEMQELLNSSIQTSGELTPDFVAQKKEDMVHENQRMSNVSSFTPDANYIRSMEGSAEDLNTAFISRRAILRSLLNQLNEYDSKNYGGARLNNTLINELVNSGVISPEDLYSGNIYDGYRPMLKYQAKAIDPDAIPERTQRKKDGEFFNLLYAIKNEEIQKLTGYIGESLSRHNYEHDYDSELYDSMEIGKSGKYNLGLGSRAYTYTPATRLLPYFTDGSDENIADAMTGYKNRFEINKQIKQLKFDNNKLVLGLDFSTPEDNRRKGAPTGFNAMDYAGASEYLSKLKNINSSHARIYAELVNATELSSINQLKDLDMISRLELLNDRIKNTESIEEVAAFRKLIVDEHHFSDEYNEYQTIEQSTLSEAGWDTLSKNNIIAAIELSSGKNGFEFYKSAMRSWGFKADGNQDIALGSRVLRMNVVSDNEAKAILGNEYVRLINSARFDKDLFLQLNNYLNIEKDLELYETLLKYEKEFRRAWPVSGKDSYDSRLAQIKATIDTSYGGLDELKSTLDKIYSSNMALQLLIDDASLINKRIIEAAYEDGPYSMVSWFIRMDNSKSDNKWIGWEHVNAFNFANQSFDDLLIGTMNKPNKTKLASLFSFNDDGYIASVTIAANNIAKKRSMKNLSKYMQDNGYMSNFELYSDSQKIVREFTDKFLDKFNEDFAGRKISDAQKEFDEYTYNVLKYIAIENGQNVEEFSGYESFVKLYDKLSKSLSDAMERGHHTSFDDIYRLRNEAMKPGGDPTDKTELDNLVKLFTAQQNCLSVMVSMMVERGHFKSANEFLSQIYTSAEHKYGNGNSEYTLVDKYGAKLINEDKYVPSFMESFDMDDAIREMRYGKGIKGEAREAAIAQMILCGDVYIMKKSLADQLETKLFTKLKHSKIYNALNKAKNLAISLIMSSPVSLLDRVVNFPTFDLGVDAKADFHTLEYVPTARATINKFVSMFDNLTQAQIDNDPDMQYLIRFLYAANQELRDSSSFRGEKLATSSLPVLKQYLKMTNQLYTIGNLIPRFAYFLNLVKNAESNGYKINPTRMGVAYHMQDGISKMTGTVDDEIYKSVDEEFRQQASDIDVQAAQIIAEHNGLEGNMPYAAKWLNDRFNTMFITFPMALLRWADNRIRSLGFAMSQIVKGTGGADAWRYLGDQVASNVITGALLLAIQLLLSTNTRKYLEKKVEKKDEEITEEEQEAAFNILFRGGQVKLFTSLLNGEETTTAAHSRGPIAALFDSYVADFIPQFNGGEKNFGKNLINKLKEKTWGHTNFIVKDAVEAIPGNTFLQSTSWYQLGENYLENFGRKVLGYSLGSAQANALFDYYKTADQTTNDSFLKKLKDGMEYAYTYKFANTKEAKSEHRNYKKAFNLVYKYKKVMDTTQADSPYVTADNKYFSSLTADLRKALQYMSDSSALYKVISDYKQKGVSLGTIKSAIKSVSLKQQVLSLGDYNKFMLTLSPQERTTIKSAIAYEDYNYPFLDDLYQELSDEYQREKAKSTPRYIPTVGSLLKTMNYNTPKNYSRYYNSNSRHYYNSVNFLNRYLNNVQYNNKYKKQMSLPTSAYQQAQNNINYGVSTDVWGNQVRNYTDGTTYNVRQPGMPFPGGNKK